jgi:uncharacterized membrane protein YphA (DoxX/SURF4 family)
MRLLAKLATMPPLNLRLHTMKEYPPMSRGSRQVERFWIGFVVRFAFGFLFLIAALNIFTYFDTKNPPPDPDRTAWTYLSNGVNGFAKDLSKGYEQTWVNFKWKWWPLETAPETQAPVAVDIGMLAVRGFLFAMPFIFLLLAVCLLTGFFVRPAMRFGAFFMILLGLGKYVTGDADTTMQDFMFATMLCAGLYISSREQSAEPSLMPPPASSPDGLS